MKEKKQNIRCVNMMILILLGCLCLVSGCEAGTRVMLEQTEAQEQQTETYVCGSNTGAEAAETETEQWVTVFVCGAVRNVGVYRLKVYSRIRDAVDAAGGFRDDADQEWLNQADYLQDGQKIKVLTVEEAAGRDSTSEAAQQPADNKINLNTAGKEELMTLPGIGEAKADAIIAYREREGCFYAVEDIMKINGIKESVFSKIKDRIAV